jgi:hypothetical protein
MTRAEQLLHMIDEQRPLSDHDKRMLDAINRADDRRYTEREGAKRRPNDDWLRANAKRDFWSKEKDIKGREYKGGGRR